MQACSRVDGDRLAKAERARQPGDKRLSLGAGILLQYAVAKRIEQMPVAGVEASGDAAPECLFLRVQEILQQLREPFPFSYRLGPWGKPYLVQYPEIYFSLSHSGDYVLCALSGREVGADLQQISQGAELSSREMRVADRFFTEQEREWMEAAPDSAGRKERFYRIWAAKEAFCKLTGRGLSQGLEHSGREMENILLFEPDGPKGYVAAVCSWNGV